MTLFNRLRILGVFLLLSAFLGACGGGGGGSGSTPPSGGGGTGSSDPVWTAGTYDTPSHFAAHCAVPRSGTDPVSGKPYPDLKGSVVWENHWIRSWVHAYYLWYSEVADVNPASYTSTDAYFKVNKTTATTSSGTAKDKFHFTYPTSQWESFVTSGATVDYGAHWVFVATTPPRQLIVGYTDPNSPAAGVALQRGASVLAIEGALPAGHTTVGMRVQLDHLQPTAVGIEVVVESVLEKVEGRRLTFHVNVNDPRGLVATGRVTRVIVETERFLEKSH